MPCSYFRVRTCSPNTQNYVEGEQILNCKHLILCEKFEQVISYCLFIQLFNLILFLVVNIILFSFALVHQHTFIEHLFSTQIILFYIDITIRYITIHIHLKYKSLVKIFLNVDF